MKKWGKKGMKKRGNSWGATRHWELARNSRRGYWLRLHRFEGGRHIQTTKISDSEYIVISDDFTKLQVVPTCSWYVQVLVHHQHTCPNNSPQRQVAAQTYSK